MSKQQTILSSKQLSVGYPPDKVLIRNLNLSVRRGELICLLGTNGAGKSTLLRTLAGMQTPLSGHVTMLEQNLAEIPKRRLAQELSLVLTERGIAPNLRVHELIAMGRHPYSGWFGRLSKSDHMFIEQAMSDTGIRDFAPRPFDELSDGEKQKVMIARALAQDTPLIILDEPTVHLDLPNRVEIMQLLHRLSHEKHKAILMSSHDLELVIQSADQLWLLHEQNIWSGIPEDLILQGKVEACFQSENLRFDQEKGSFVIRRKPSRSIRLSGEGISAHWTQQALERAGYQVVEDNSTNLQIHIQKTSPAPSWIIQGQGEAVMCRSLSALLNRLKEKTEGLSEDNSKKG